MICCSDLRQVAGLQFLFLGFIKWKIKLQINFENSASDTFLLSVCYVVNLLDALGIKFKIIELSFLLRFVLGIDLSLKHPLISVQWP